MARQGRCSLDVELRGALRTGPTTIGAVSSLGEGEDQARIDAKLHGRGFRSFSRPSRQSSRRNQDFKGCRAKSATLETTMRRLISPR